MSHSIVPVSRKTKAALMNHVLRAYILVATDEPVYAAEEYDYIYGHDAARFILLHNENSNFMSAAQKQFEDLNKVITYEYIWDATKLEKDYAMEVQHTAQKDFLREYLFAYATEDGRTQITELLDLSAEMSGLPETELTWLTRAAGTEIFNLLTGWRDSLGIDKQFSRPGPEG